MSKQTKPSTQYPFLAPCKSPKFSDLWKWFKAGLHDVRRAPVASLTYGAIMTFMAMSIFIVTWRYGNLWLVIGLLCAFVFAAPLACVGTYAISAQLERNQVVSLRRTFRACLKRCLGSELVFALILLVVFLVWARASSMVSIFLPANPDMDMQQLLPYVFGLGTVSILFLSLIFTASVFSLPMIMHRDVDAITAVITSINAVLRNKMVMIAWGVSIAVLMIIGFLTFGVALVVLLPAIGHSVWHAYLDTIDASAFPRPKLGITAVARPVSE